MEVAEYGFVIMWEHLSNCWAVVQLNAVDDGAHGIRHAGSHLFDSSIQGDSGRAAGFVVLVGFVWDLWQLEGSQGGASVGGHVDGSKQGSSRWVMAGSVRCKRG